MLDHDTLEALVSVIAHKDYCTAAHTWRVTLYMRAVAERLGWDDYTQQRLVQAAALHDIGKIDIPSAILQKPGKLTDEEFEIIQSHTVLGFQRLMDLDVDDEITLDIVRYHHERWDGKGYPDGLAGIAIPVAARHFAIVDTFDALTSIRPYRRQIGKGAGDRAIEIIHQGAGTRYELDAVEIFSDLYQTGQLDWIMRYHNDAETLELMEEQLERPAALDAEHAARFGEHHDEIPEDQIAFRLGSPQDD